MDNENTFDKLPVEMISHIFEFLKLKHRKVASTVCWSWYHVSIQPRFLNKEVICLKYMNNMHDVLNIYTKSLRPYFAFRILGLEIKTEDDEDEDDVIDLTKKDCWDWVYTIWPLLASKVTYLEFFDTVKIRGGILPALLSVTQQLKVLKIRHVQYNYKKILHKVNRLQSLEELEIEYIHTFIHSEDDTKLLGVIPETLRKLCVKSLSNESKFIIKDLIKVIKFCSSHLQSLELFDVNMTYKVMKSMVNLNMNLKKFHLCIVNPIDCARLPEIISLLLKTQWPLVDLKLRANCFTYEHVFTITDTFKDLEKLSVSGRSERSFETLTGISGSSFETLSRLTKSIDSLTKLKSLYIGVER
ncbi:hypothetical protein AGLY_001270 [Aphis glycines]|uniref:F-box domain-containing protein n=1 Tax=Aphis glycines TaxID=307491 RepID=A0A6G0U9U0_APHGL|nr:hypothetical protein AGLY_001270 [Aphis glycines]